MPRRQDSFRLTALELIDPIEKPDSPFNPRQLIFPLRHSLSEKRIDLFRFRGKIVHGVLGQLFGTDRFGYRSGIHTSPVAAFPLQ